MVAFSHLHTDHNGGSAADSDEEYKEYLLNIFIQGISRMIFHALTRNYHNIYICAYRPHSFVQQHGRGDAEILFDKRTRERKIVSETAFERSFCNKDGNKDNNRLYGTAENRTDCRTAKPERGKPEISADEAIIEKDVDSDRHERGNKRYHNAFDGAERNAHYLRKNKKRNGECKSRKIFSRKGYNRFVVRENACQSVGKDQQRGGIYNSETHRNGYCKAR